MAKLITAELHSEHKGNNRYLQDLRPIPNARDVNYFQPPPPKKGISQDISMRMVNDRVLACLS